MNYPKVTKVTKVKRETRDVKTITFEYKDKVSPGQFFMIWIPNVDEIPMSVSHIEKNTKGITFRIVGEATNSLFKLKKGNKIGIRGPYGNGFKIKGKRILFVGGGTGIAMILPAVEEAIKKNIKSTIILGSKNKDELFFEKRLENNDIETYISTDDGSKGFRGLTTDLAKKLLNENSYDSVYTCGPELMMKKLFDISEGLHFQASLERYMKCAIGICGQCCIGDGLRVCKDGPVFDEKTLKNVFDFGIYKKDAAGIRIKF